MNKFDGKKVFNAIFANVSWIILGIIFIVCLLMSLIDDFGLTPEQKTLTTQGIFVSICGLIVYFTFQRYGVERGKMTGDYITNAEKYADERMGVLRTDIEAYLKFIRETEKQDYIDKVCDMTNLSADQIFSKTLKEISKDKQLTIRQKKHIRRIIKGVYPDNAPKNAAVVLNVLADNPKSSHGVDPNAKKRFLIASSTRKIIVVIALSLLTFSFFVEFKDDINWAQTAIRLTISMLTMLFSVYGGYTSGYKSTAEIEKDILGSMCRFLSDMKIWLEKQATPKN